MYRLPHFKENSPDVLLAFMEAYPFVFLTGSNADGRQVATQVPVLTEERNGSLYIQGHLMRQTDHQQAFAENPQVLAVFTGPNSYVSATWYSEPHVGSTWNYMSVHVHGNMRFMTDSELMEFMRRFTLKFEQGNTQSPTVFDQLPAAYLERMMPAIVGFEIKAERVEHVFKLSQQHDEAGYRNIIAQLEARGGSGALVAGEMKKRLIELFPKED